MLTQKKNKGEAKAVRCVEFIVSEANTHTVRGSIVSEFSAARPSDPTDAQILGLIEQSGTLEFWSRDEEDVYTREDGEPISL